MIPFRSYYNSFPIEEDVSPRKFFVRMGSIGATARRIRSGSLSATPGSGQIPTKRPSEQTLADLKSQISNRLQGLRGGEKETPTASGPGWERYDNTGGGRSYQGPQRDYMSKIRKHGRSQ